MRKSSIFVIMFFAVLGLVVGTSVSQAADSLTGTWDLSVDSPAGKGNPTFVLQQDGEKVTGTYKGVFGESKVTGKIQGSDFELSYNSSGLDVTYKGKIEGNKIKGNLDMGSYGKGTFTGEKK
jgi:hypothetical protein